MRVILVGGRSFARSALERVLSDGHEVPVVWAADDALEVAAREEEVGKVWRKRPDSYLVEREGADLLLSVHNHMYIPPLLMRMTRLGALGYHPSLLPRHRGIDAVRWTIHDRDPIAGGSMFWLDEGIDTGPLGLQNWCHVVPEWDASALWREALFPMGLELVSDQLHLLDMGVDERTPQDERVATYEPPWREQHLAPEPEVEEEANA